MMKMRKGEKPLVMMMKGATKRVIVAVIATTVTIEMEVRRMDRAKAKAKGLPCPPEPLKPYTPTLNGKCVKAGDSQHY